MSANSNSALALASGQFIALMMRDDALPEHALYWVAKEIIAHPDADPALLRRGQDRRARQAVRSELQDGVEPALMLSQKRFSLSASSEKVWSKDRRVSPRLEGSQDQTCPALRAADVRQAHTTHPAHSLSLACDRLVDLAARSRKPDAWHGRTARGSETTWRQRGLRAECEARCRRTVPGRL